MWPTIGAGLIGAAGQWISNAQSQAQSREQMRFQERMSSTAYQRSVKDMKKAGINPMLAAARGGASSPGGAAAQAQNVGQAGVSSAVSARQVRAQTAQMEAAAEMQTTQAKRTKILLMEELSKLRSEIRLNRTNARFRESEQTLIPYRRSQLDAQARAGLASAYATNQRGKRTVQETKLLKLREPELKAMARFFETELGSQSPWFRYILPIARQFFGNALSPIPRRRR